MKDTCTRRSIHRGHIPTRASPRAHGPSLRRRLREDSRHRRPGRWPQACAPWSCRSCLSTSNHHHHRDTCSRSRSNRRRDVPSARARSHRTLRTFRPSSPTCRPCHHSSNRRLRPAVRPTLEVPTGPVGPTQDGRRRRTPLTCPPFRVRGSRPLSSRPGRRAAPAGSEGRSAADHYFAVSVLTGSMLVFRPFRPSARRRQQRPFLTRRPPPP
mmetsp:Transcript_12500/g.28512  ORF Transcript_12500/g.28512 Transcript_12500/m.28512 type:complete len:212 (-) Transcript_12500:328-963(-)